MTISGAEGAVSTVGSTGVESVVSTGVESVGTDAVGIESVGIDAVGIDAVTGVAARSSSNSFPSES